MRTPLTAFQKHKRGMPSRPVKSRSHGNLMFNYYILEWANSPVYRLVRHANSRENRVQ